MMVYINLWEASSTHRGPHGTVHRGCWQAAPHKWCEAESPEDADRTFPDRTLFWCTRYEYFGCNPRALPRR